MKETSTKVNPITDQPSSGESGSQGKAVGDTRTGTTRAAIWPTFRAAYTSFLYTKGPHEDLDISEITRDLQARNEEVWEGDLLQLEAMLNSQAHCLDAMFHVLAERAALNMGKHLSTTETYLKLALRAQTQCARTVEVLAGMKSPPVVIAQQANIAQGHQQVNNGTEPVGPARKTENPQNQVLEDTHGERLDPGATSPSGGNDSTLAAVGAFERAEDSRG